MIVDDHLDLVGPSPIQSYKCNFYTLIIVDDHSNYTWVVFVESKEDVLEKFKILCIKLENLHDCSIVSIITNHSSEFDKLQFESFCEQHGMSDNLSGPFTSQSSEIVERTHRKIRKMSRAMYFMKRVTDNDSTNAYQPFENRIPLKSWEKNQLHPHLNAWADVLLTNVFAKIEAKECLPIIVGYMLYCIKTKTPFNFSYFIAQRLSGLDYNNEALPYARVMTTLFEYLKNKHPNDASRMIEVEELSSMCPSFTMESLEL
ncbi:retrovirus-related pol polyprotein from transposon TNT 1-94 [Tanacetum coccineum]|uniref:Retrovirus-related pol polyprotein from transposon TNT 1-94 n=1 Tax=Tanacetum coccineum TaxID=301880 RepID=A0ABQ5GV71_9ASTR